MFAVVLLLALITSSAQSSKIDPQWIMQAVPLTWSAFECIFKCVFNYPKICSVTGFTVKGAEHACPCHPAIGGQYYLDNRKQIDCLWNSGWLEIWDKTKGMFEQSYCGLALDSFPQTKYEVNPLAFFGHNKNNRVSKIENGKKALPLQFPWALRVNKVYNRLIYYKHGTAVLIHPRYAVTAAHVALMTENLGQGYEVIVSGGDVFWARNEDEGRWSSVEWIRLHPTWYWNEGGSRKSEDTCSFRRYGCVDLAVVKLSREIANTNPACLPETHTKHTNKMRLVGWGTTTPNQSRADAHHETNNLRWTDTRWEPECPLDNKVCSGPGSLPGDSGSGWMVRDEKPRSDKTRRWTMLGLHYAKDGSRPQTTRLLVDMRKFKDWICEVAPEVCQPNTNEKIAFDT